MIPRGTTYRFRFDTPQRWLSFYTPGEIETPEALPQPLRPAARARAVLPARLPPAGRRSRPTATRGEHRPQGARARRLPGLRARLPPVRRRRLGRLRLPVHVQHRRLRAEGRAAAPAAARAPDVPGPELRDLLVLPAHARLGRRGDRAPLPPLQRAVRGGHVLRRRALRRRARASRSGCITLHPSRPPARAAAGAGGEVARRQGDRASSPSCATRSGR